MNGLGLLPLLGGLFACIDDEMERALREKEEDEAGLQAGIPDLDPGHTGGDEEVNP